MIKAYLYPQFEIVDNCYVMDNPARVEVELPALPVKGMEVLCLNQKEIGISQKFFESCEEQLLKPNSVINEFLCKLRENIRNKEERTIYNIDSVIYMKDLSNIGLLEEYVLGDKLYYGFSEGVWLVDDVHMIPYDEYVHIDIVQEV